jgi:hypothetical protein
LDKVAAEAGEVIDAIAKIFAELTSRQDAPIRQQLIEELTPNLVELRSGMRSAIWQWHFVEYARTPGSVQAGGARSRWSPSIL